MHDCCTARCLDSGALGPGGVKLGAEKVHFVKSQRTGEMQIPAKVACSPLVVNLEKGFAVLVKSTTGVDAIKSHMLSDSHESAVKGGQQ